MEKLIKRYDKFEEMVLVISLALTVLIIFVQVVMRKLFNNSLSWSEELARYIFIWQIWLGVSIGFRDHAHIRVEIVLNKLKGTGRKVLEVILTVVVIAFLVFLTYQGGILVQKMMMNGSISPALKIPLWVVNISLPVSCFISTIRLIVDLFSSSKTNISTDTDTNTN